MRTRTKLLGGVATVVAILGAGSIGAVLSRSPDTPNAPVTEVSAPSATEPGTPTASATGMPPSPRSFPPYEIPPEELRDWLSVANDVERRVIEDGVLTFEEYEFAVMRTILCIESTGMEIVHSSGYGRSEGIEPGPRLSKRGVYSYFARVATDGSTPHPRAASLVRACKRLRGTIEQMWAYHTAPTDQELADMREHTAQCLRDAGATVPDHPSEQDLRQASAGGAIAKDAYRARQFAAADAFEIESPPGYSIPRP